MNKIIRGILAFAIPALIFASAAFCLSSCSKTGGADTGTGSENAETTLNPAAAARFSGYVIMRSDSGGEVETDAAIRLRKALSGAGCDIELTTDWVSRGDSIPDSAAEILVGNTNRAESVSRIAGLKYDDFVIAKDGPRIVISGGSEEATGKAVDWFIENALGFDGEALTPYGDSYEYRYDYPVSDATINGVSLGDFVIEYGANDDTAKNAATELQTLLRESCGYYLEIKKYDTRSENYIILSAALAEEGYSALVSGTTLTISADGRLNLLWANNDFIKKCESDGIMQLDDSFYLTGKAEYSEKTIWLDANLTDNGDGSEGSPYNSFDSAQSAALELASTAPYHITMKLSAGSYTLGKTIELTGDGFGKYSSTLEYVCEDEEQAVLGAWLEVGGFSETTVNGVTAWEASLPSVDGQVVYPHQMFSAAGERLNRPRLPETGFYYPVGIPGYDDPWNVDYTTSMNQLVYADGEIPQLSRIDDIQMRMFHYWDDEKLTVQAIDYDARTITFTTGSEFAMLQESSANRGAPYYLDNVFEALDSPGEIYADRETGKLFYIPRDGEKLDGFCVYISSLDKLMTIDGMYGSETHDSLTFKNLAFTGSDWTVTARATSQAANDIDGAVTLNDSTYVTFENCDFAHIGTTAVKVVTGVNNLTFDHCDFYDLGAGGIHIQGVNENPATENVPHDITVSDCHIASYGRVYANGVGILLRYAYGCLLSHNEICDGYYSGISCGWVWGYDYSVTDGIVIEYNHIYDIGQELLSDMGGIYTLGSQPNTVIRNNLIHDVQMSCYGGWGIYPDEGSSDILIENNICYNFSAQPFHQHYGKDNIVRNNIFAFGEGGAFIITRKEDHNSLTLEHNILVTNGAPIYAKSPEDMNFKDDSNLVWDYSASSPSCGYIDYDVYTRTYDFKLSNRISEAAMKKAGLFNNAVAADPMFADPMNGDFTLDANSPAFDLGFTAIDMSEVGVR